MIQKKELPWFHNLRIVQLFEADFNSALKFLMDRRLMKHSETNGIGKSSIEVLITLRVMYDMARADRLYMVSLFNDLKGCYDRIRPPLNTITTKEDRVP